MAAEDLPKYQCYLAFPHSPEAVLASEAITRGVMKAGCEVFQGELPWGASGSIEEATIGQLARSDCVIADVTGQDPTVFFELGLAKAMGKGLIVVGHHGYPKDIAFGIPKFPMIPYEANPEALSHLVARVIFALTEYRRSPPRSPVLRGSMQHSPPFFIDWERLEKSEVENLCRELLSQMGFQRIEWGKITPEIDLVAQLPRKDPDGFEYREFWLVSMGLHVPIEAFLDAFTDDPDFLLRRILSYSESFEKLLTPGTETPITFLIILFRQNREHGELNALVERMDRRRMRRGLSGFNVRFRIWDQAYLTSLVHQFPQIAYKYFSDESRIRSKTRKSYEELYRENSDLGERQAKLIGELEEEKNKRVRAERDAIWKDISFSAAHKIGNPIFAIETDLDPLVKRIREQRGTEAEEVVINIRSSVEKAKAFVEQFKSLARAQKIKQTTTLLRPLLEDATRSLSNTDIVCQIDCPADLAVWADPDRLAESLDELVANAEHWLDKPEKTIELKVVFPVPEPLPSFLDSSKEYVLLHVKDNGCGIPAVNKRKVFDAFFTTYDHGTGLGLALVRRIIDGHGGGIVENGIAGQGADFEIYLPIPSGEHPMTRHMRKGRKR
jgi:signal transduction histidine kinase